MQKRCRKVWDRIAKSVTSFRELIPAASLNTHHQSIFNFSGLYLGHFTSDELRNKTLNDLIMYGGKCIPRDLRST